MHIPSCRTHSAQNSQ